jgi:hypothetical protein
MASGDQLSLTQEQFEARTQELLVKQAQATRNYVSSQVEGWQQLPLLALMANGKNGWSSQLSIISECGVVRVGSGKHRAETLGHAL